MVKNPLLLVPNIITIARILAILPIVYLVTDGTPAMRMAALILFVLAAASDWIDGYLARAWNQYSDLGRMLDPIADKLLVGIVIAALAWQGSFSRWDMVPVTAMLFREFFIPGLREFLGRTATVLPVSRLAKWKTTLQLLALTLVLLEPITPGLLADIVLWAAGLITLWTGLDYLRASWPHLSKTDTP